MIDKKHIDALLDADEKANSDNPLAIFALIQEGRRGRQHAKDKEKQEPLDFSDAADVIKKLKAAYEQPYTEAESNGRHSGSDQMLLTLHSCFDAGDLTDVLYALVRQCRKMCIALNMTQDRR